MGKRGLDSLTSASTRKSQVSLEYISVVGMAFLMIVPLIIVFSSQQQQLFDDIADAQAGRATKEIAQAADSVYYMGPPATRTIRVIFPQNIDDVILSDGSVVFNVTASYGSYSVVAPTVANLTGTISSNGGLKVLKFTANMNNVVVTEE